MAKIFGSVSKNEKKRPENKQPDLRGAIKIGGYTGENAESRNREAAQWLRNIAQEFATNQETFISLALWKRIDQETGNQYLSICLEDNSWKTQNGQQASAPKAAPKAVPDPPADDDDLIF